MLPAALGVAVILVLGACESREDTEAAALPPPEGAASAGTPDAARAGLEILAAGGNAADAAVAAALAQTVTEPGNAGLGGWGVAVLRIPGRPPVVVDVPRSEGAEGDLAPPTLVRLLEHLWREHGSGVLTWEELVAPAVRLARDGFPLGRYAHRTLVREYGRLYGDSVVAALVLTPDRAIPSEGSLATNPDLALTLAYLGEEGPAAFYEGEIGVRLAGVAQARGLTGLDAAALARVPAARERPALEGTFMGWTVAVPPEPWAGPELLRALEFLEGTPVGVVGGSPDVAISWMAEALAHAFGTASTVSEHMASVPGLPMPRLDPAPGDELSSAPGGAPRPTPPPTRGPAAPSSGSTATPARPDTTEAPGLASAADEAGETTHLSIADRDGMVVSLTHTLGRPYGAGWTGAGLGFFPGQRESTRPLITGRPDSLVATRGAPSEREWMVPTIVTRGDTAYLALGSPGGRPAVSAVAQVLARWLAGTDSLYQVVARPRVHVGQDGQYRGRIYLEGMVSQPGDTLELRHVPAVWGDSVPALATQRQLRLGERDTGLLHEGREPWFGGVNAAGRLGDRWLVAADPRRDGGGLVMTDGRLPPARTVTPSRGAELPPPLAGG